MKPVMWYYVNLPYVWYETCNMVIYEYTLMWYETSCGIPWLYLVCGIQPVMWYYIKKPCMWYETCKLEFHDYTLCVLYETCKL